MADLNVRGVYLQSGGETEELQDEELIATSTGPKRGDHVINNGVLKVYRNIREEFMKKMKINKPGKENPPEDPFTPDIRKAIGEIMVVKLNTPDPSQDDNSKIYGKAIVELRGAVVLYMRCVYHKETQGIVNGERQIESQVIEMLQKKPFIDEKALEQWKREGNNMTIFKRAMGEVENMFKNLTYRHGKDMLIGWVKELTK